MSYVLAAALVLGLSPLAVANQANASECFRVDQKVTLTGHYKEMRYPLWPGREKGKQGVTTLALLNISAICVDGTKLTVIEPLCWGADDSLGGAYGDFYRGKGKDFTLTGYLRENVSPHIYGAVTLNCE